MEWRKAEWVGVRAVVVGACGREGRCVPSRQALDQSDFNVTALAGA